MCECCENIDLYKNEETEGIEYEVNAEIVQLGFKRGKKTRMKVCRLTSRAYDLNYCPKCGRRLI